MIAEDKIQSETPILEASIAEMSDYISSNQNSHLNEDNVMQYL